MDITSWKNWVVRIYLKLRFLKGEKQTLQEKVNKLLNPVQLHKDSEEN